MDNSDPDEKNDDYKLRKRHEENDYDAENEKEYDNKNESKLDSSNIETDEEDDSTISEDTYSNNNELDVKNSNNNSSEINNKNAEIIQTNVSANKLKHARHKTSATFRTRRILNNTRIKPKRPRKNLSVNNKNSLSQTSKNDIIAVINNWFNKIDLYILEVK